jgi:hypothetical protein
MEEMRYKVSVKKIMSVGYVTSIGEISRVYTIFIVKFIDKDDWRDRDVDGRLIITWIVNKWVMRCRLNHLVQRRSVRGFLSSQKWPFLYQKM